ncbi:MAG: hypothetical protein JNL11_09095 [Bdellovibrionaceae bacterium]|nr:hypothetical protein [Pseudobdellovibrionaceae bacterium]
MGFLSKVQSAKVYEYLLWLIFLAATFFIGFFHGSSPEKQINFYYQDTKKIDLLVHHEDIIPVALIKYLEKETHTQINTIVRKTYKDFRTEIIVNKNISLLVCPEAFIEPLHNDNRIRNIDSLMDPISKSVHSDFQPQKFNSQIYSLPMAWFVNVFSPQLKSPQSVYMDYIFLLNQKTHDHFFQFNKNFKLEKNWTKNLSNSEVYETTLQLASLLKKPYRIDPTSSFLMTYSLAVPNNTPDRKLSLDVLKIILLSKEIKTLLKENGLGQTFLSPKIEYSHSQFIAPDSIRNLNLNNFRNANKIFEEVSWN